MPKGIYPKPSPAERFERHYIPEPNSGCWLWTGGTTRGYGMFSIDSAPIKAHRASWILFRGPIPLARRPHDSSVLHKCDNPPCVNPNHLFLGTGGDNNRDTLKKGRHRYGTPPRTPMNPRMLAIVEFNRAKTRCPSGHAYAGANLYRHPNKRRICRECIKRHARNYRLRQKNKLNRSLTD